MINTTLIWLLALPIVLGIALFILRKDDQDSYAPIGAFVGISLLAICIAFFVSKGSKTWDTEIWNGQIVSKDRVHGSYQRAYDCNCRTVTSGSGKNATTSRQCDTCYEDHYTVKWSCESTVGGFSIDSKDWTNQSVYLVPDPQRYTVIKKGDPAAREHRYTNYVQAVPDSLFTPAAADLKAKFAPLTPKYPDSTFDFYKINRFFSPGITVPDAAAWNEDISMALRERGPKKQVNAIIVVAKTNDPTYEYALRDSWEGANKNDVVLIIGSSEYPKIDFVRVLSWTKNETFKVELRDAVMDKGVIDRSIVETMMAQIDKNFERRHMSEFEYLDGEIDPPMWLNILLVVLVLGGAAGLLVFLANR